MRLLNLVQRHHRVLLSGAFLSLGIGVSYETTRPSFSFFNPKDVLDVITEGISETRDNLIGVSDEDDDVFEACSGIKAGVQGDIWKATHSCEILEEENDAMQALMLKIRDKDTPPKQFVRYANRLWALICEGTLCELPDDEVTIETSTGHKYRGSTLDSDLKICAVSIHSNVFKENAKASDALLHVLTNVLGEDVPHGEIIVSQGKLGKANSKGSALKITLPPDVKERTLIVFHPVISSGQSVKLAINALKEHGIEEDNIYLVSILTCPEAVVHFNSLFPGIHFITAALDKRLDDDGFNIVPGVGHFGQRYMEGFNLERADSKK